MSQSFNAEKIKNSLPKIIIDENDITLGLPLPAGGGNSFMVDIDINHYHKTPPVSSSNTANLLECPVKYHYSKFIMRTSEDDESAFDSVGNMVHTLVLEPHKFHERYFMAEKVNRTTNKGKAQFAEQLVEANGRKLISPETYKEISYMCEAVLNSRVGQYLSSRGIHEHSIFWFDEETKVWVKSRPDFFNDMCLIDLKTTRCASRREFARSIGTYGYHRQAAIALDALKSIEHITGKLSAVENRFFINVCVEKTPPYVVSAYILKDKLLNRGKYEYTKALQRFWQCLRSSEWPGYIDDIEEIDVLPYAITSEYLHHTGDQFYEL